MLLLRHNPDLEIFRGFSLIYLIFYNYIIYLYLYRKIVTIKYLINMNLEQKYKEMYEIGFPIFQKLFQLKKDDFIKVMKDIFQDNKSVLEILDNNPKVIKTISDDEPDEIAVHFYSSIKINYIGISYKPEHGNLTTILKFDKFFNIDAALNIL